MSLQAVFWDNDGVLVDTERLYFDASVAALARAGVDLTESQYADLSLRQGRSTFDLAVDRGLGSDLISELRAFRDAMYARLLAESEVGIEGVAETLGSLHGRVRMGVVTSAQRAHFEIVHRRTGFPRYFDFVLAREDYRGTKPSPDPYLAALAHTGLPPEQCVVVEDTERGLAAAAAAGIRCIVVPNALAAGGDFSASHKIVRNVVEAGEEIARLLTAA